MGVVTRSLISVPKQRDRLGFNSALPAETIPAETALPAETTHKMALPAETMRRSGTGMGWCTMAGWSTSSGAKQLQVCFSAISLC